MIKKKLTITKTKMIFITKISLRSDWCLNVNVNTVTKLTVC